MRKNKAWFSVLLVSATLTLTACNTGTSSSMPDYSFEGFTVLETATGELGTYYTFETPEITYGEKSAAVTVTVTGGDETIRTIIKRCILTVFNHT